MALQKRQVRCGRCEKRADVRRDDSPWEFRLSCCNGILSWNHGHAPPMFEGERKIMAKAKLTNFAQVLRLLSTLTDDEKATLRDVLRPTPTPRTVKKSTKKPKVSPEATLPLIGTAPENTIGQPSGVICAACGNDEGYTDHFEPSPHYHAFEPPRSAKGATKKAA